MENSDTNETEDEKIARALAGITESPSAIERQIAAASALRYSEQTHQNYRTHRRQPYRFGLMVFCLLFLLIVGSVILVFTDLGRPLQKTVSAMLHLEQQSAAHHNSSPANDFGSRPSQSKNNSAQSANITESTNNSQPTYSAEPKNDAEQKNNTERTASKNSGEVVRSNAISVPIADVSLRNRPELLEQLVQIYRAQLTADSNNSTARAALDRLQKQSLAELETIAAEEDEIVSIRSLELVSRLFPDLAENARYKYVAARMDRIHREPKINSEPKAESQTEPKATAYSPAATISSTPVTTSSTKSTAPASDAAATAAKKAIENAVSSKPDIRVLSITSGAMVDQRFVPGTEGKVFMVEISYRNFKNSADESEPTLVARLGTPGDSMVLAEAPVDILGDRGTKSFLMEALVSGSGGETYKLNFILNGEFLASRTLRVSTPAR